MVKVEQSRALSCHQKDMYDLQREYVLVCRELEQLRERTKDYYPKEFVEWLSWDEEGMFEKGIIKDEKGMRWVDLQGGANTLDELFTYWKTEIKK